VTPVELVLVAAAGFAAGAICALVLSLSLCSAARRGDQVRDRTPW
jgi:hypothetical protein